VEGSPFCERHLRGRALAALDRKRWPRLTVAGKTVTGDEQWRPWLREADGIALANVLTLLREEGQRDDA
jgi:hypothetical protein